MDPSATSLLAFFDHLFWPFFGTPISDSQAQKPYFRWRVFYVMFGMRYRNSPTLGILAHLRLTCLSGGWFYNTPNHHLRIWRLMPKGLGLVDWWFFVDKQFWGKWQQDWLIYLVYELENSSPWLAILSSAQFILQSIENHKRFQSLGLSWWDRGASSWGFVMRRILSI